MSSYDPGRDVHVHRPDGGGNESARVFDAWSAGADALPPYPVPKASRRSGTASTNAQAMERALQNVLAQPKPQADKRVAVEEQS